MIDEAYGIEGSLIYKERWEDGYLLWMEGANSLGKTRGLYHFAAGFGN